MHEYGLMQDVVNAALRSMPRGQPGSVACIRVEVGEFLVASRESLETAFEIHTRGTALEGSRLEVSEVPGLAVCEACGFRGSGADLGEDLCEPPAILLCPYCSAPLLVTSGGGITVVDVQLEDRGRSSADAPESEGG